MKEDSSLSYVVYRNGNLTVCGFAMDSLVAKSTTPVMIGFADLATSNIHSCVAALSKIPRRTMVFFSVKTNDEPNWLRSCTTNGLGLEVVTLPELTAALRSGCEPRRIIFNGPNKSRHELEAAVEMGIGLINVDSHDELMLLNDICCGARRVQRIGIRVCVNARDDWNKFGVVPQSAEWRRCLNTAVGSRYIHLDTLHIHHPSTFKSSESLRQTVRLLDKTSAHLAREGVRITTFDLGGGLAPDRTPDFGFEQIAREFCMNSKNNLKVKNIIFEFGKALVNDVFVTVAKCGCAKVRSRLRLLFLDVGVNVVGGNYANMRHDAILPLRQSISKCVETKVCGPMCFSSDVITEAVMLPQDIVRDDLVLIPRTGAYTLSLRWRGSVKPIRIKWVPGRASTNAIATTEEGILRGTLT